MKHRTLLTLTALFFAGCVTPPPATEPIAGLSGVYVAAEVSGGQAGFPGLNESVSIAADQAFTEVLLNRGYHIVDYPRNSAPPTDVTHYFKVVINEAYAEQDGSKKTLQVEVSSKLIEAKNNQVVRAVSTKGKESSRNEGAIVQLVGALCREAAAQYPYSPLVR